MCGNDTSLSKAHKDISFSTHFKVYDTIVIPYQKLKEMLTALSFSSVKKWPSVVHRGRTSRVTVKQTHAHVHVSTVSDCNRLNNRNRLYHRFHNDVVIVSVTDTQYRVKFRKTYIRPHEIFLTIRQTCHIFFNKKCIPGIAREDSVKLFTYIKVSVIGYIFITQITILHPL